MEKYRPRWVEQVCIWRNIDIDLVKQDKQNLRYLTTFKQEKQICAIITSRLVLQCSSPLRLSRKTLNPQLTADVVFFATPFFDAIFKSSVEQMENLCLEDDIRLRDIHRRFFIPGRLSLMFDAISNSSVEELENLCLENEFRLKDSDRHFFLLPNLSLVVFLLAQHD